MNMPGDRGEILLPIARATIAPRRECAATLHRNPPGLRDGRHSRIVQGIFHRETAAGVMAAVRPDSQPARKTSGRTIATR